VDEFDPRKPALSLKNIGAWGAYEEIWAFCGEFTGKLGKIDANAENDATSISATITIEHSGRLLFIGLTCYGLFHSPDNS